MKHLDLNTNSCTQLLETDHGLEPLTYGIRMLGSDGTRTIRYLYKINLEDISHIAIIIIDF